MSSLKPPPLPLRKPQQIQSPVAASSASPRTGAVEQEAEAKFKTAQAKAKRAGVETLTQKDIEGLVSNRSSGLGATSAKHSKIDGRGNYAKTESCSKPRRVP